MINKTNKKLEDKVTIVTGAARGIGKAIAKLFARNGASVVINVFNSFESGCELANEINDDGGKATCIKADISKSGQVKELVDQTLKLYKKIDIVVNNSGIGSEHSPDMATKYLIKKESNILTEDTPYFCNIDDEQGIWDLIYGNNIVAPLVNTEKLGKFKVKLYICPLNILDTSGLPC